jgi:hypothetical protein
MLPLQKKQEFMLLIQEAIRKLRKEAVDPLKLEGIIHRGKQLQRSHTSSLTQGMRFNMDCSDS